MKPTANDHHLVMGEIEDFLTGAVLADTHDERYRQKVARKLVINNQFHKRDIESNLYIEVTAGGKKAGLKVDFLINENKRAVVMIKYAPGSLVTRRLTALALSRIVRPYQVPLVVMTNGEDAELIDGETGKVLNQGFDSIPNRDMVLNRWTGFSFKLISSTVFDQASRIVFACEVEGACPCDSDICRL